MLDGIIQLFINQFQLKCCDKIKQQQSQFQQHVTFVVHLKS